MERFKTLPGERFDYIIGMNSLKGDLSIDTKLDLSYFSLDNTFIQSKSSLHFFLKEPHICILE
jgi:hypothetical protein